MSDTVAVGTQEGVSAPPRHPGGRPSKFTPEMQASLLRAIRRGDHFEDACQAAGLTYTTFREWVVAGDAGEEKFAQFSEAVHKAEVIAKRRLLKTVRTEANKDWRPASWLLARRWPDQYADQSRRTVQHTGEITVKHEHLLTGLDLDAVRGLLQPPTDPGIIDGTAVEVPSNES